MGRDVAQLAECLPSMPKAPSSIISTTRITHSGAAFKRWRRKDQKYKNILSYTVKRRQPGLHETPLGAKYKGAKL